MSDEASFLAFFGSTILLGPKTPSPSAGRLALRWSSAKLLTAAVAFWHIARGSRAVFDGQWPPRMRVFWSGIKRSRVHVSSGKPPFLSADVRAVCDEGARALARLRSAVEDGSLPRDGSGLEPRLDDATSLRGASSIAVAFFRVRRASGVGSSSGARFTLATKRALANSRLSARRTTNTG